MIEDKRASSVEDLSDNYQVPDIWRYMPDSVLLSIFQYLTPKELLTAGEVCRSWERVSKDEFLWKDLFYHTYKIDPSVSIMPGELIHRMTKQRETSLSTKELN